MAAIFQMTFSKAFSWIKMCQFRLRFHQSLFPRVQLKIFQHWFRWRLGTGQSTSHYLNQWWPSLLTQIWVSELILHGNGMLGFKIYRVYNAFGFAYIWTRYYIVLHLISVNIKDHVELMMLLIYNWVMDIDVFIKMVFVWQYVIFMLEL